MKAIIRSHQRDTQRVIIPDNRRDNTWALPGSDSRDGLIRVNEPRTLRKRNYVRPYVNDNVKTGLSRRRNEFFNRTCAPVR